MKKKTTVTLKKKSVKTVRAKPLVKKATRTTKKTTTKKKVATPKKTPAKKQSMTAATKVQANKVKAKVAKAFSKTLSIKELFKNLHDRLVRDHQNLRNLEHHQHYTGHQNIMSKKHGMQMNRVPRTMHHSRGK